jgi:cytoskeletal protein CcmA (bactofilin family)
VVDNPECRDRTGRAFREEFAMADDLERTILSAGTRIKGEVHFAGPACIAGTVEGLITTGDPFELTASGTIIGELRGTTIDIHGTIRGNVVASECCRLGPTARVTGEIRTGTFSVAQGARFHGPVSIGSPVQAPEGEAAVDAGENPIEQLAAEAAQFASETAATSNADLRILTQNVQKTLHSPNGSRARPRK